MRASRRVTGEACRAHAKWVPMARPLCIGQPLQLLYFILIHVNSIEKQKDMCIDAKINEKAELREKR